MNNYDKILTYFLGKDSNRPALMQANTVDDLVFATDAKILIAIPKHLCANEYPAHEQHPSFYNVFSKENTYVVGQQITLKNLFQQLKPIPKKSDYKECEKCSGKGELYCKCCGNTSMCHNCEGIGIEDDYTLPDVYDDLKHVVKINDDVFTPYNIGKLIDVAKALGETQIKLYHHLSEKAKQYRFVIGELQGLVMPYVKDYEDNDVTVIDIVTTPFSTI